MALIDPSCALLVQNLASPSASLEYIDRNSHLQHHMSHKLTPKQTPADPPRALATAEGRLARADERIGVAEAELRELRAVLEATSQSLQELEAEHGALQEEYRAMGDDLEVMVKENQVRLLSVSGHSSILTSDYSFEHFTSPLGF